MSLNLYAAFILTCAVMAIIPGPTATLIVANALRHCTYALLAGTLGRALSRRRLHLLTKASGACLIGGGLWLAVARR
jgi:threonine/homoserine/homoserine lactone efflux protein